MMTKTIAPSMREHERLREMLGTVAQLAGYTLNVPVPLPDGSIPDVARVNLTKSALFVGDAKNTETPWEIASTTRLLRYSAWVTSVSSGCVASRTGTLAVCFNKASNRDAWLLLFRQITHSRGLNGSTVSHASVDARTHLVWTQITPEEERLETPRRGAENLRRYAL